MNVDFQSWLASNDPFLTEGAVIERVLGLQAHTSPPPRSWTVRSRVHSPR